MIHGHPPQRDALLLLSGAAFTLSSYALFPTLILCPLYLSFSLSLPIPLFLSGPLKEQARALDNLCDSHSGGRSVPAEPDQS